MTALLIILAIALTAWFFYQMKTAPLVEDEVDELLKHLYGSDKE